MIMQGPAAEDGIERIGADCCRPKNPDNIESFIKIHNNTSILEDRAAEPGGMKHNPDTPDLSIGVYVSRSAAQFGDLTHPLGQNDKNGPLYREEPLNKAII